MFYNKRSHTDWVRKMFHDMKKLHNKEKVLTHNYRAKWTR